MEFERGIRARLAVSSPYAILEGGVSEGVVVQEESFLDRVLLGR